MCLTVDIAASMGASEGKSVGQWFGPNTIAQVLRYVAMLYSNSVITYLYQVCFVLVTQMDIFCDLL